MQELGEQIANTQITNCCNTRNKKEWKCSTKNK